MMDEPDLYSQLLNLATGIAHDLDCSAPDETIQLCGLGPLQIIASRPNDVLEFADAKINAYPYHHVPKHWRRLFEEVSLHKAVGVLRVQAESLNANKRRKLGHEGTADQEPSGDDAEWASDLIAVLERGLLVSGGPGRNDLFQAIFHQLREILPEETDHCVPATFTITRPPQLESQNLIPRAHSVLSMEAFQTWLNDSAQPLIIPDVTNHWPAAKHWQNPRYLLNQTLGGKRTVPVEVGASFTDHDWSQKIMPFKRYVTEHLLPANPKKIGYLAQHDLFWQMPDLKADIITPDYVYTIPPPTSGVALQTAGLNQVEPLDDALVNAWLGPKGTKTPLHTDPYHNILCQVVGYKYIRLYPPDEKERLYPLGVDNKGMHMDNTSSIDIARVRQPSLGLKTEMHDAAEEIYKQYPRFEGAKFVEEILAPGECLYIPLGWWHYVESLSTSFSVSFWWN
ncbi:Clavaminate synthase-like protein [Teratosphaeria nubilosa]|uniref:Clavaminate synthase-like protein n=1 Tax=Teratosphaeria nubilosa TaxID=161662 RepID=A0A6G1LLC5_9PEZI|nr:Clavaminate synthase-like protein [Teratosphaeria nubilosa]